jgi:hypothetical protein
MLLLARVTSSAATTRRNAGALPPLPVASLAATAATVRSATG